MPPSIILVRPQMGENIGASARAMMNFGLSDLRLVAPRDGWPNPKAHEMSANADSIVEAARIYSSLPEAIADCNYVLASTARRRDLSLPSFNPEEAITQLTSCTRPALLFGPENNGLSNDDIAYAHACIHIPTSAENPSLNIAMAVNILAYEWYKTIQMIPLRLNEERASANEVEYLIKILIDLLDEKNFFRTAHKKPSMLQNIRTLMTKPAFSSQEIKTLQGIIRALTVR